MYRPSSRAGQPIHSNGHKVGDTDSINQYTVNFTNHCDLATSQTFNEVHFP